MDAFPERWYYSDMSTRTEIPAFQLYGEHIAFPDILHMEQIRDRAAGFDWIIKPHRHTHIFQLFMLFSGDLTFQLDGGCIPIAPPVALGVPPGSAHGFRFSSDTEGWVISLPCQHYPDLFGSEAELAKPLSAPLITTPPQSMDKVVAALFTTWQGNSVFRRTQLRCQLGLILSELVGAAPTTEGAPARPDARIARFQALIGAQAVNHWPISAYAEALGLSERTLGRLCKTHTGLGARDMIEAHLMHEASRLLAYTQMSAQSVAHALGFDDASYFSRRFRRFSGLSPSAYRRKLEHPVLQRSETLRTGDRGHQTDLA